MVFDPYNFDSQARVAWWCWLQATISFEGHIHVKPVNWSVVLLSVSCGKIEHNHNLSMQCLFNLI